MSQNTTLLPQDRLNKNNFEEWQYVIENILESEEILDYIKSDVLGALDEKLKTAKKAKNPDANLIQTIEVKIKKARKLDAKAKTIISTNVSHEVLEKVKGLKTSFAIMEKIKNLYGRKKSSDVQYLLKL